jgi:small subunit ribosomal protein S20
MPQHKSNEKRMRTSALARLRNRNDRSECRTVEKNVLEAKDKTVAQKELVKAYTLLDHMADKGVLQNSTVARHKSKLTRHINKMQG